MRALFLNTSGDLVPWDALDEAERAFYADPSPWVVTEFGLTVREYVLKWHADAAMHEAFFEHPE